MGEHAKLSPSAASRWMACPGSVALLASLGNPDKSSEAADEGTFLHDVTAKCLALDIDAELALGEESECGRFKVDEDTAAHVQTCLDVVRELSKDARAVRIEERVRFQYASFAALHGRVSSIPLVSENDLHAKVKSIGEPTLPEGAVYDFSNILHGTADVIIYHFDGSIDVVDFKYGAGIYVDANKNPQLRIYALCAVTETPSLADAPMSTRVGVHVVQPRHYSADEYGAHRVETLTLGELVKFGSEVVDAVLDIESGECDDAFHTGDHCRWCAGPAHCPKLREEALETTRVCFSDVTKLEVKKDSAPPVVSLNDAAIGRLLKAFPKVEEWMKAVREHAYTRAVSGIVPPGFKLVQKFGNRKWTDEKALLELCKKRKVDPYSKPSPKVLSPAQLEKKLGKALVELLAEKPLTGTVLVEENDPRPAALSARDVFKRETENQED